MFQSTFINFTNPPPKLEGHGSVDKCPAYQGVSSNTQQEIVFLESKMRYIGWVLVVVGEARSTQCNPYLGMRTRRPGTRCQKAGSGQPPDKYRNYRILHYDGHIPIGFVFSFGMRL